MLQLLGTSCWYRDNCITKLWALSSYFLYLYMVFIQHCFHIEQHFVYIDRQFSCSPKLSNWLSRIPTQSSLVIQNYCSSWLSCTLPGLMLNQMCVSDGIVPIMYLRSFVGSEPNLDWDKIATIVAEYSDFLCAQSLCTQSEKLWKIMKEWRLRAKVVFWRKYWQ